MIETSAWDEVKQIGSVPADADVLMSDDPARQEEELFTSETPELATWAMMIIGFGGVGLQLRRRAKSIGAIA